MNEKQFTKLAERLIKSPEQRKAVISVYFGGSTAYAAEKQYNRPVSTVKRDVGRIKELWEFCNDVTCS